MKNIAQKIVFAFILSIVYLSVYGQLNETYSIPLSQPGDPGKLVVHVISGAITVEGHTGKDVVITASGKSYKSHGKDYKDGLKRIESKAQGFRIEERDNTVRVNHNPGHGNVSYTIKVPTNFSVDLKTLNGGNIIVGNVSGSHEVSNTNGAITMHGISGSVIADALNQDIEVSFDQVDDSNAMMFTSLNGDVDISFPSNLSADIKAISDFGDVFTDFEISSTKDPSNEKISDNKKLYKVTNGKGVMGKINGGGVDIIFKTMNGDIIIREHKE